MQGKLFNVFMSQHSAQAVSEVPQLSPLLFPPSLRFDLICTDAFVPELWMIKYQETAPGQV